MKNVYLFDIQSYKHVLTIQKPDDYQLPSEYDFFRVTKDDVVSDPDKILEWMRPDRDRDGVDCYWFAPDDWVWFKGEKMLKALVKACHDLEVIDIWMHSCESNNIVTINFVHDNKAWLYDMDENHFDPLDHPRFDADYTKAMAEANENQTKK